MTSFSINSSLDSTGLLTPESTADVSNLTQLWSLARMARDLEGDPFWDALFSMGCNPETCDNLGFFFDYHGLKGIYFPGKSGSNTVRFTIPRLSVFDRDTSNRMTGLVNMANSMVSESRFAIMGDEVWLIHERFSSGREDYGAVTTHILENLKTGAELFHQLLL